MERPRNFSKITTRILINSPVTALPFDEQIKLIMRWASEKRSKVVCVANVHMLIEAYRDPVMDYVLRTADLVTPDGMPLVWMLKLLGCRNQDRVAGLDILLATCRLASEQKLSVYFLGSESFTLQRIKERLQRDFPDIQVAGMEGLPFRPLTEQEDQAIIQKVNKSGAGLVFVSLGCPKQELWMHRHKDKIKATMIGLGGAFPVYAGMQKRAPSWIRTLGMEWAYRLLQEPKRLWKRYIMTIPIFLWLATKQLLYVGEFRATSEMSREKH
jgi:N-acetylglucosaminyldiphosphoundecaprenol N-acetyl-beta-D-mannosaminyltransferase